MFKPQFGLLVMATLLLSPTFVDANEIGDSTNLSVGNIRIQTNSNGGVSLQTPNINLNTAESPEDRLLLSRRTRGWNRRPIWRRGRVIYSPSVVRQSTIIRQSNIDPYYRSSNRTSTVRTFGNGIHEQHHSVNCRPGSGSSVSQSSQTINGRVVRSKIRTNCS